MGKPSKAGEHKQRKVETEYERRLGEEEHMVLYERLARVMPGPVGKGVGSARSRSKKSRG